MAPSRDSDGSELKETHDANDRYSYGNLLVITGYKWNYTFYKWGKSINLLMIPSGKRLQKTMERSTMLSMGKSTISMIIFNSYVTMLNYQKVGNTV